MYRIMIICVVLLAMLASLNADSIISGDELDETNILEATRILGSDIMNTLVTGVTQSLPYVQKMLAVRPSDEECSYVTLRNIEGLDNKIQHLIVCLLKGVDPEDSDNNVEKIKDKITSAAIEIIETIPDDNQCRIEELQNVTLEMGINHPVYLECVIKLIFRNIATIH